MWRLYHLSKPSDLKRVRQHHVIASRDKRRGCGTPPLPSCPVRVDPGSLDYFVAYAPRNDVQTRLVIKFSAQGLEMIMASKFS